MPDAERGTLPTKPSREILNLSLTLEMATVRPLDPAAANEVAQPPLLEMATHELRLVGPKQQNPMESDRSLPTVVQLPRSVASAVSSMSLSESNPQPYKLMAIPLALSLPTTPKFPAAPI